jgi:alanyl-tRNA synthetase
VREGRFLAIYTRGVIILPGFKSLYPRGEKKVEETKKLYFDFPYQRDFSARIVERRTQEGRPALVLDQTCFYPESGGQPFDIGTLAGVNVLQVFEAEGKIVHVVENDILSEEVIGNIDWTTRFDHMQQHAGQHVLSQSFFELYKAETLSFHLGEEVSTLEMDLRNFTEDQAARIEERANAVVFENREIKSYFVSEEQVKAIPLRRPPKKHGLIRVVEVAGFDFSACGGTHPYRTGEIGLVKILKWDRIRDNIRFDFVCGKRAMKDYALKHSILREMALSFTVIESEVPASVAKISTELKDQKKRMKKIQERLMQLEAQEMIQKAEGRIIKGTSAERTVEGTRHLALNIINSGEFIVLFGSIMEGRGHLILAASESLGFDTRELIPIVSPLVEGKGGGSPSLVEIFAPVTSNIEKALDHAFQYVLEKI